MRLLFAVSLFLTTGFIAKAGDSLFVYGTVTILDTKENPYGASIYNRQYRLGVITNKAGSYKLFIPDSLLNERLLLEVKYVGCDLVKQKVRVRKRPVQMNFTLKETRMIIKDVIGVPYVQGARPVRKKKGYK